MGMRYKIEHYGVTEFDKDSLIEELGDAFNPEKMRIEADNPKILIHLAEVDDETDLAMAKLIRLSLTWSDAIVVTSPEIDDLGAQINALSE